ncbi:hypothetical protein M422DRAFT_25954 [Sphaerobolus stellatus SS14]|nr:hypothetical protein M422DRAFT_25954 [Sphaerobolus stellatus SS14]
MSIFVTPSSTSTTNRLPAITTAGIVIAFIAGIGLFVFLLVVYVRRKRGKKSDVEKNVGAPMMAQRVRTSDFKSTGKPKLVSRTNFTSSITLPLHALAPLPPKPAAKQPSKPTFPHGLAVDIVAADFDYSPFSTAPFSPSSEHGGSSIWTARTSIIEPLHRKLSRASSGKKSARTIDTALSSSPAGKEGINLLEVRHIFTPASPDKLVLRIGESLIRSFEDGWCSVSRKSPFESELQPGLAKPSNSADAENIEIGVVPMWVFGKHITEENSRPPRTASMRVTLLSDVEEQEDA